MLVPFHDFLTNLVVENLHPELHAIATGRGTYTSKQALLAKKIKDLTKRRETTGIEGNMPKGSSRAYLKHKDPHKIILDGKEAHLPTGTKVAIRAALDKHHKHNDYEGHSLGAMQNHAEGGDHWVNQHYRVLTQHPEKPQEYKTNHEGIFPPLIDHDDEHHEWTHVGHARDIKPGEFRDITKSKEHPKGISHKDFVGAMNRFHNKNNGKHWDHGTKEESHLDHVDKHPLVQKFQDYHGNTGHPTADYGQQKNLGVFEHPHTGERHIVARDHGFNSDVEHAYGAARRAEADAHRRLRRY